MMVFHSINLKYIYLGIYTLRSNFLCPPSVIHAGKQGFPAKVVYITRQSTILLREERGQGATGSDHT